eukprot:g733.t1
MRVVPSAMEAEPSAAASAVAEAAAPAARGVSFAVDGPADSHDDGVLAEAAGLYGKLLAHLSRRGLNFVALGAFLYLGGGFMGLLPPMLAGTLLVTLGGNLLCAVNIDMDEVFAKRRQRGAAYGMVGAGTLISLWGGWAVAARVGTLAGVVRALPCCSAAWFLRSHRRILARDYGHSCAVPAFSTIMSAWATLEMLTHGLVNVLDAPAITAAALPGALALVLVFVRVRPQHGWQQACLMTYVATSGASIAAGGAAPWPGRDADEASRELICGCAFFAPATIGAVVCLRRMKRSSADGTDSTSDGERGDYARRFMARLTLRIARSGVVYLCLGCVGFILKPGPVVMILSGLSVAFGAGLLVFGVANKDADTMIFDRDSRSTPTLVFFMLALSGCVSQLRTMRSWLDRNIVSDLLKAGGRDAESAHELLEMARTFSPEAAREAAEAIRADSAEQEAYVAAARALQLWGGGRDDDQRDGVGTAVDTDEGEGARLGVSDGRADEPGETGDADTDALVFAPQAQQRLSLMLFAAMRVNAPFQRHVAMLVDRINEVSYPVELGLQQKDLCLPLRNIALERGQAIAEAHAGPIKIRARAEAKVRTDYACHPDPVAHVLDFVRVQVKMADPYAMAVFYELVKLDDELELVRVKNKFSPAFAAEQAQDRWAQMRSIIRTTGLKAQAQAQEASETETKTCAEAGAEVQVELASEYKDLLMNVRFRFVLIAGGHSAQAVSAFGFNYWGRRLEAALAADLTMALSVLYPVALFFVFDGDCAAFAAAPLGALIYAANRKRVLRGTWVLVFTDCHHAVEVARRAARPLAEAHAGPLKSWSQALEAVTQHRNFALPEARVLDLVHTQVLVADPYAVYVFYEMLKRDKALELVCVRNTFVAQPGSGSDPEPGADSDSGPAQLILNVRFGGHVCEIQVALAELAEMQHQAGPLGMLAKMQFPGEALDCSDLFALGEHDV